MMLDLPTTALLMIALHRKGSLRWKDSLKVVNSPHSVQRLVELQHQHDGLSPLSMEFANQVPFHRHPAVVELNLRATGGSLLKMESHHYVSF
jgi:hypothetical protein